MSPVGKVFLVLNLAFAALFLGAAASLIGTSQKYRGQLSDAEASHSAALADKDNEIGGLNAQLAQSRDESSRKGSQVQSLEAEKTALTQDLETERAQNADMRESLGTFSTNLDDLEQTNRTQGSRITELEVSNQGLREERDGASDERDAAHASMVAAQESERSATSTAADLRLQLARQTDRAERSELSLAAAARQYGFDPGALDAQPDISGQVVAVSYEQSPAIIQIGVGRNDDVQPGYTFDVYNAAGVYKGRIRVEVVNATNASCTIDLQATGGARVERGDRVVTRV